MNPAEAKRRLEAALDAAREEADPLPGWFEGAWIIRWSLLCRDSRQDGRPSPSLSIVPARPPYLRKFCATVTDGRLAEEEAEDSRQSSFPIPVGGCRQFADSVGGK